MDNSACDVPNEHGVLVDHAMDGLGDGVNVTGEFGLLGGGAGDQGLEGVVEGVEADGISHRIVFPKFSALFVFVITDMVIVHGILMTMGMGEGEDGRAGLAVVEAMKEVPKVEPGLVLKRAEVPSGVRFPAELHQKKISFVSTFIYATSRFQPLCY